MSAILIIEDDFDQRLSLVNSAKRINGDVEIYHTDSIAEAFNISIDKEIKAFFIDIMLIDGSGIELAKKIRGVNRYKFTPMVFITGILTKEMEAFRKIHCHDYIIKPYTQDDIDRIMESILMDYFGQFKPREKYLNLQFRGIKQRINIGDIVYVESKNRKIFIRTRYEEIWYKHMNLTKFMKELPKFFIQVHQSIAVNPDYIRKYDKGNNQLFFHSIGEYIPVGISFKDRVGEMMNEVS